MMTVGLAVLAVVIAATSVLVLAGRRAGGSDRAVAPADWQQVDAEVISMLQVADRTFLRVRFSVGTSLIQNDLLYPLPGAVPHVGRRVPIRYDPAAPAQVTFDLRPGSRPPLEADRVTRIG